MTVMTALMEQTADAAVDVEPVGGVVETAHTFGDGLVGVLTRPAGAIRGKSALILLNAGLVQRVGPFRMYVQMARALAEAGFVVFRFDQSGLGDSPVSSRAGEGRKLGEAVAAMNLVTALTGMRSFVLGGLCSGADDAFNIAPHDLRVNGLLLLDGVAYPTFLYKLRHVVPRLLNPAKVMRGIGRILRRTSGAAAATIDPNSFRDFPSRPEAIERLKALETRGADMLLLYTGGVDRYYNHRRQARECFGDVARSPRIRTEYWADCDHTFYVGAHRRRLVDTTVGWMTSRFRD